jgi:hypothetical protein
MVQAPAVHAAVAFASEHTCPHVPQFDALVCTLTSHPSATLALQFAKPALHEMLQLPVTHTGLALASGGHTVEQLPQWLGSFVGFTQLPPHMVSGDPHVGEQVPLAQTVPAPHACPHVPQLALLLFALTSQPSALLPLQSRKPAVQAPIAQCIAVQAAPALAKLHALPHAPQLVTEVIAVSQPLAGLPSQSAKPAAQRRPQVDALQVAVLFGPLGHTVPHPPHEPGSLVRSRQMPKHAVSPGRHVATHDPDEQICPAGHELPQLPQLALSACVLISQPSAALPLQSANPKVHVPSAQWPAVHEAEALAKVHTLPHAAQLPTVERSVSQPFIGLPSQSPKPAAQLRPQWPAVHTAVLFDPLGHTVPHAPHAAGSLVRSWQSPEQLVRPARQVAVHPPDEHTCPAGHTVPHAPQLALSVWVFTSQPSLGAPLQSTKPVSHAPIAQWPAVHKSAAWAKLQTLPHAPQLAAVFSAVSQPLVGSPSQSPKPAVQVSAQCPPAHAGTLFGPLGHTLLHEPHAAGSLSRSRQAPMQSVSPVRHVAPHAPPEQA